VTLAPDTLAGFAAVAARHDIALVIDETYRLFRGTDEPAHRLFAAPRWTRTVVSLHSFSKDLAIPGYRVGAVVASAEVAAQRQRFETETARRPGGFELLSCGGFFGWVRHPYAGRPTEDVVRELVRDWDILVVPGTAFGPDDRRMLRVSVGNAGHDALADFADRLDRFSA
jgi:aspartate/methionine/tyrosine aminotransferase